VPAQAATEAPAIDPADPLGRTEPAADKAAAAPARRPTWPCPKCGANNSMEDDACHDCGAGFLSGATSTTNSKLPVVGDMAKMSQGSRLMVGAFISVGLIVVFVLLATIGGHVFN
jgi:hypothetical protein